MKRLGLILLIPVFLLALERVNLVRNAGFERNDSVWIIEPWGFFEPIPAEGSTKDSLEKVTGRYSASVDTREEPEWNRDGIIDSVAIRQEFLFPKTFADIDSLIWNQVNFPAPPSPALSFRYLIGVTFGYPERDGLGYGFVNSVFTIEIPGWLDVSEEMPYDSTWEEFRKSCQADFQGVAPGQELVSFTLDGWGYRLSGPYYGQKTYWDDIRLMGYADYDVGVKEIVSEASLTVDTPYVPMARVKNFGRENADSFLVIAVIEDSSAIVYVDTLPWSLAADTEDTVSFAEFIPFHPFEHVLTVYTVMTPDESDADDRLSLNLFCSVCQDSPEFPGISMKLLNPITPNYLRVSYALPVGQLGTISVYDAAGRIQYRMNVRGVSEITITADLTPAVYFIRLDAGEESVTHKAVVLS